MHLKRYEAVDMNEAIKMVKNDLGSDAVIISSRKVRKGGGKFGLFGRSVVEVTAASDVEVQREEARSSRPGNRRYRADGGGRAGASAANTSVANPGGANTNDANTGGASSLKSAAIAMEPMIDSMTQINKRLDKMAISNGMANPQTDALSGDVRELKSMISYLVDHSLDARDRGGAQEFSRAVGLFAGAGDGPGIYPRPYRRDKGRNERRPNAGSQDNVIYGGGVYPRFDIHGGWIDEAAEKKVRVMALFGADRRRQDNHNRQDRLGAGHARREGGPGDHRHLPDRGGRATQDLRRYPEDSFGGGPVASRPEDHPCTRSVTVT